MARKWSIAERPYKHYVSDDFNTMSIEEMAVYVNGLEFQLEAAQPSLNGDLAFCMECDVKDSNKRCDECGRFKVVPAKRVS